MSARRVWSGSCPCRYHSERAISAPFKRPETRTLMPRAPKRSDAFFELHRHRFGDELGVELRLLDLLDVDEDLAIGPLLDFLLQLVDFRPLAADDDTRPGGVN